MNQFLKFLPVLIIIIFLYVGCSERKDHSFPEQTPLFTSLGPEFTGLHFINEVKDTEDLNVLIYTNFYNGGGVAIGDINNDGLSDIYFTANMGPNRLYLNRGNLQFEDVTEKAGVGGKRPWSTGVAMVDINADGWLDIYVCSSGDVKGDDRENELFINQGNLTFREQAAQYGLNDTGFSTHTSFFDYDGDGDLDCYVLNNSFKDSSRIELFRVNREERDAIGGDKLFRNDGDHFTDVSEQAGIYGSEIGFGLGVSVSDLNHDMLPDIYISNDFWERDYLYLNNGDGTFSEELINRMSVISLSSMGADLADINNDGHIEVLSTDMLAADNYRLKVNTQFDEFFMEDLEARANYHYQILQNCLHLNDGEANFQELGFLSGVAATDWSWGALIFDFENDGWKDIFICNGVFHDLMDRDFSGFISDKKNIKNMVVEQGRFDFRDFLPYLPSTKLSNYALVNQKNLTFQNNAEKLGLGEPSFSNGAAYGDLDNDGDLDLVINNVNMPCFVYRNETSAQTSNHFLKIAFNGPVKNHYGIGSEVRVYFQGRMQVAQHFPIRGYQSSMEPGLLFGLGNQAQVDSLVVTWSDLAQQVLYQIKSNQTLTLSYDDASSSYRPGESATKPLYTNVSQELLRGNYNHRENQYNDFEHERLLLRVLSTDGPRIVKGDVNGDQLEDFILLGATDDYDKIFLQRSNGTFQENIQETIKNDSSFESTCGVLFDPDNDQDLDLLIGAGGNEHMKGIQGFLLRFYENDGKGNFTKVLEKTPPAAGNISCIKVVDLENDGDQDLFLGGRTVPGNYGLIPRSFLLRNDGNNWTDTTPQSLAGIGMVTDGWWNDMDGDGYEDLLVIGDWMPITLFKNNAGNLQKWETIEKSFGWWNSIEGSDLDGDGDEDYVLGNWGLNTKFKASPEKPLTMYVKDFDINGKSEFIINWYAPLDDISHPFASKMDITAQLPPLNDKVHNFSEYAQMTYEKLFTEEQRNGALQYQVNYLQSAVLWNLNQGQFKLEALPLEAQVAPVFGIVIEDLDWDGIKDIWLGGNFYGLKPEVGRHNSSKGVMLIGDDDGGFTFVSSRYSGIYSEGEVRDATLLEIPGDYTNILISRNNDSVLLFKGKSDPKRIHSFNGN